MNELFFPLKRHGIIIFNNPSEIKEKSCFYGQQRTKNNAKLHEIAPEYDRGRIANNVDELGVTAELIAIEFLEQQKIPFTSLDIVEDRPIKTADVFIENFKIDVKGVRFDNENLTVNYKAHFQKDVTHYWFIKPFKDNDGNLIGEAEYWIIPAELVTYWNKEYGSFTPFFYKKIVEINKLYEI